MFRLARPDVLSADDYGLRKDFVIAFEKRELRARTALEEGDAWWKLYRTMASWHLWHAVELATK